MDGLTLVQTATAAGLELRLDSGKLVIRGPKRLAALVAEVIQHKPEVMAALERPISVADGDPDYSAESEREAIQEESRIALEVERQFDLLVETAPGVWNHPDYEAEETIDIDALTPCSQCGSYELRQTFAGAWHCRKCEPNRTAERLIRMAETIRGWGRTGGSG